MTEGPHPIVYGPHAHLAGSLCSLLYSVNQHWPHRDTRSDGGIGDDRHKATKSDHNPDPHTGAVRAFDFDADGINAPWLAEQLRTAGLHGDPRLTGGGYVIWDHHITSPDFSHWMPYDGPDPHTSHVHVSVTANPVGYEYSGAWSFLAVAPLHPPVIPPAPPAPLHLTGHDLEGAGEQLRGELGDAGPKVEHLQEELNAYAPAYSHLQEDGVYGEETAAVLAEFSHREAREADTPPADRPGLAASDGHDLGPRTARSLVRDHLI